MEDFHKHSVKIFLIICRIVHHDSTRRADPKTLQHENSDSVWNELAFFRKQYQILKKERFVSGKVIRIFIKSIFGLHSFQIQLTMMTPTS